ncbi:hypothetical protein BS47DRAFT_1370153, partial [Hydnum rufescens UP504]
QQQQQQQQRQPQHMTMTTHPLKRVCGHKIKTKKNDRLLNEWPQANKATANETGTNETTKRRHERRRHKPHTCCSYRLNHPPNERPKRDAKNTPQMKPGNGNARREAAGAPDKPHTRFGGCVIVKQNGDPPNEPPLEMKIGPANDDHPNKTLDKTTHPPKRVCGNFTVDI